jgi:hypothetical protein
MLRRIPSTPLVCLVVFLSTIFLNASWAAGPDESLDILLKPNQAGSAPTVVAHKAKAHRAASRSMAAPTAVFYPPPPPMGITKVKRPAYAPFAFCGPMCILPAPRMGQWEMSAQAFFATVRGKIAWPRYSQFNTFQTDDSSLWPNLTDQLQLPAHQVIGEFAASYQFRPNWAVRFSVLGFESSGGGWVQNVNNLVGFFVFGNQFFTYGQQIQSKWTHTYTTLGLVYDPIRTCRAKVSVFANWVHIDDRINVGCNTCGFGNSTFSKNTDAMMVGLQFQKCLVGRCNGGSFSTDCKAGAIFLDNVEGWDVELGGRYSIPLGVGRWGYLKGGYRLIDLKKSQADFVFNNALEGGFVGFGFIF